MTPATEFWLTAYLLMLALVTLLFALVGVQRLAWWLADRPRRQVGEDLGVTEYEDAAAEADAEIERVVADFRAEIDAHVDRWARS